MTNQNIKEADSSKSTDVMIVAVAAVIAAAGIFAFTFLTDQSLTIRLLAMFGAFVVAVGVAAISPSGKRFIAFGRESYAELRRVVWPTRRETLMTTGMVVAFVVAMSFFLFVVDKFVEWGLYDGLLRITF